MEYAIFLRAGSGRQAPRQGVKPAGLGGRIRSAKPLKVKANLDTNQREHAPPCLGMLASDNRQGAGTARSQREHWMKRLISLFMLTIAGIAQPFELGSSMDDVYLRFGVPKKWWLPDSRSYITDFEEYRAAAGVGTVVQDVYERQTATHVYEIHLIRRADPQESRLQPKFRLSGLDFLLDKPGTFRDLLADIEEVSSICADGCNLYGMDDTNHYSVLAYPINPAAGDTEAATDAAYGYEPDFRPRHKYNWGLRLNFKKPDYFREVDRVRPDWLNAKIENVQIRPAALEYELRTWGGLAKPEWLGRWQP